jgi:hypothetical protein
VVALVAALAVTVGLIGLASVLAVTAYVWGKAVAGEVFGGLLLVTLVAVYLWRRRTRRGHSAEQREHLG